MTRVQDPHGAQGRVTRTYREGGVDMVEVTYDEPQWDDQDTLDWAADDVTEVGVNCYRCPKCKIEYPERATQADAQLDHNLFEDCDGTVIEL